MKADRRVEWVVVKTIAEIEGGRAPPRALAARPPARAAAAARTGESRRAGSSPPRSACRSGAAGASASRFRPRRMVRAISCRGRRVPEAEEVERLGSADPERRRAHAVRKLQGQHAHADQVRTVDPLKCLGDDCARRAAAFPWPPSRASCQCRTPARRRSRGARARSGIASRRRRSRGVRRRTGGACSPFDARHHEVLDAHVRERSARHHAISCRGARRSC